MAALETPSAQIEVGEPVTDRRRSPRQERATTAWVSAASGAKQGNGFNVTVRDLSLHGVGLLSNHEFRKQDTHWVIIADQSLRLSTRFRVVNQRQRAEDGVWEVGGEFF